MTLKDNGSGFSLSVVVPNRNDARYLERCIGSVLEQDPAPDELVILDDVSTDHSVAVIERAIAGCTYARLVRNETNLGATENSNKGLTMVSGRFVYFLGANDFVLPGLFAAARAALCRHPQAGIWSAMVWAVDEADRFLRIYPSAVVAFGERYFTPVETRELALRFGNWLTGQTTVYRREALREVGGFNPALRALTDLFAAHVVASRHGACFTPRPLAAMRLHEGSFLAATVRDKGIFDAVVQRISTEGPALEPPLYTSRLVARTARRLRFSSLRSVASVDFAEARCRMRTAPERPVRQLAFIAPLLPRKLVVGLLFALLRPFDLLPTLWYRFGGTAWIILKERLAGQR